MIMYGIRLSRIAAAAALTASAVFGVAGTAFAGTVTWQNNGTGWRLQSTGIIDLPQDGGTSLFTAPNTVQYEPCTPCVGGYWSDQWDDFQQADGSWTEESLYDLEDYGQWVCLDGNNQYGTYGRAYAHTCGSDPGDDPDIYQHWREIPTETGWALQNVQTGLWLDGGNGPNGNGQFANVEVYVNGNYGNGDAYQRWT
jgi:hypothetical protein